MTTRHTDALTADQAAVWATVQAINRAWTQGNPDELKEYFHRDMVAITASDRLRREGRAACLAGWKDFAEAAQVLHWDEREPLVQIYGETAIVTYYYDMRFAMHGEVVHTGGRDMFVLIRDKGRWWVVADQYSSYPRTI